MEKDAKEKADKKLKEGWIKAIVTVEVMAISEDTAKTSLIEHVSQMKREDGLFVASEKYLDIRKIEKPFKGIEAAYSYIVELETLVRNYERLVFIAMNYGPSGIEIIQPNKISLELWEAQGIVNSVSEMMHKLLAVKGGGFLIKSKQQ